MSLLILKPPIAVTDAGPVDVIKVRRAMTKSLQKAAFKIVQIGNMYTDHIPPITTNEANPFPYQIVINPKPTTTNDTWNRIGFF